MKGGRDNHLWHPFTQMATEDAPLKITRARGAWLEDEDGRRYLDLTSSWWVVTHGHGHPHIAAAVAEQALRLPHVMFAGFTHEPARRLAAQLTSLLPEELRRVFFSDNGAGAVEAALKIAWQYWVNRGEERRGFLAFQGGYHGDTLGAMSAGLSSGFYEPFRAMALPFSFAPWPATFEGDNARLEKERHALGALETLLERQGRGLAAAIVEPLMQGASGMRMCSEGFLREAVRRIRACGALVIFDEVMTGFGRSGAMFACERADVVPDMACLAKGLTGGFLPLAATVVREEVYEAFLGEGMARAFTHGHSYSGNPLGCAAACASLELFEREATLEKIAEIGVRHERGLERIRALSNVARVRRFGAVAAFEVTGAGEGYGAAVGVRLRDACLRRGLLLRPLGNVVYLMPPYCITEEELARGWRVVAEEVERICEDGGDA